MDWKVAREKERAALKSIVALLFALADLAERACGRSRAVRGFVLWLLRPAETLVRELVAGTPATVPFLQPGDGPADAMRLAGRFRDLARELGRQAALAFGVDDDDIGPSDLAWFDARGSLVGVQNLIEALAFLTPAQKALRPAVPLDTS